MEPGAPRPAGDALRAGVRAAVQAASELQDGEPFTAPADGETAPNRRPPGPGGDRPYAPPGGFGAGIGQLADRRAWGCARVPIRKMHPGGIVDKTFGRHTLGQQQFMGRQLDVIMAEIFGHIMLAENGDIIYQRSGLDENPVDENRMVG